MVILDELKNCTPAVSVGIVTADMMNLASQLECIEKAGVKLLHFDVMDGCFCPAMTFGAPFIKAVRTSMLKDVHLMIDEPLGKIEAFAKAGADMITVHPERNSHLHRSLQLIGEMENVNNAKRGIARGLAINPGTPLEFIRPVLGDVDMIFLLAVNPGFGRQKFIDGTRCRLEELKKMISNTGRDILVGIDGGIKKENIREISSLGVDIIVTGSAVFDGRNPAENAKFMLQAIKQGK
ncbi:MAG: ribulose-phosphate 3-epimerase [Planctomycetota bacterium]